MRRSRTPLIMAVVSGSPGIGSGRLARGLAAWFANRGQGAALLDLSICPGAAAGGRHPPPADHRLETGVPQGLQANRLAAEALPAGAAGSGGARFSGPALSRRVYARARAPRGSDYNELTLPVLPDDPAAEAIAVLRFLEQLRRSHERIVVDTDGGAGSATVAAVLVADVLIVASRAERAALLEAYAAIKWFTRLGYGGRVGVVISGPPSRGAETAGQRLAGAAARFLGLEVQALGTFSDAEPGLPGVGAAACGEGAGGDGGLSRIAVRLDPGLWPGPLGSDVWLHAANLFL